MDSKLQNYSPPAVAAAGSPTTFVQADATSFRDLVQMLTGSDGHSHKPLSPSPDPMTGPRRSPFKLQERRNVKAMRKLEVKMGLATLQNHVVPSPVTPLGSGSPFCLGSGSQSPASPEEKAIAEKGFYLHPPTPRGSDPPELLTLFPLSSPCQRTRD